MENIPSPQRWNFEDIIVGYETELISCFFTAEDLDTFTRLSGNYNPLHTDDAFAKQKGYSKRLAHGMLLAAKFSYLVGMVMPGKDCLCLSQSLHFHKPIFVNDACTLKGTVISKSDSTRTLEIKTELFNAENILAVSGIAKVKVI